LEEVWNSRQNDLPRSITTNNCEASEILSIFERGNILVNTLPGSYSIIIY
jgi:hypothetical protein